MMTAKPSPKPRKARAAYSSEISACPVEALGSVAISAIPAFPLRQDGDLELIEARHAVGLGPQRHAAGLGKSLVRRAEQFFAIEGDSETLAFRAQAERMPFIG